MARKHRTRINCSSLLVRVRSVALLSMLVASTVSGWAQGRLGAGFHLQHEDMAVLESGEPRADFSCRVIPDKPELGFDLRFHADYRVIVPIKALADAGSRLGVLLRVTPAADIERPVYLGSRFTIPDVSLGAKGEAMLAGGFDIGFGHYQVDWMMRDGRGRVCSSHWELDARQGHDKRDLPLALEPNMVAQRVEGTFGDEPFVEKAATKPLHLKILLNLSPVKPRESFLKPEDAIVLLSILRSIIHEPGVRRFTLVAFNVREQRIIYRQDNAEKIDFAAIGKAVQAPTAGTVNYHLLQDKQSETHFITKLLTDQLGPQTVSPDAIIIVGPKVTLEKKVPLDPLKQRGATSSPIFYLNYNSNPIDEPFHDTIGSALKAYRGAFSYNIVLPRDLGSAIRDMLFRMGKQPT